MKKSALRRLFRALMTLVLFGGIGAAGWAMLNGGAKRHHPIVGTAAATENAPHLVAVKTIHPRHDANFRITTEELATVHSYFSAELRSRVAGVVKNVYRAVGEEVQRGEPLIELDVPDLLKELEQKDAVIAQRSQELKLAQAELKQAEAAIRVAQANVEQKRVEVTIAETTRDFRAKRLKRFQDLAARGSVTAEVVDEQEREYLAAEAEVRASAVAVTRALADVSDKEASLEAAQVDIELKQSLIEVARKDRERVAAMFEFTRIVAPFSGMVTRRNVDPGDFIPNSTSSTSAESLLTVERLDLVTVSAKVADNTVSYLSHETEAVIELDDWPGIEIRGRVTRFAPSIDGTDRTVRVEVDLFNGSREEYWKRAGELISLWLSPIGGNPPLEAAANAGIDFSLLRPSHKGAMDTYPAFPEWDGVAGRHAIFSGMTGRMRLALERFTDAQLLPSSAVFTLGGKPYILVVEDGKAKRVPVRIQINDGQLVKVAVITHPAGTMSTQEQVRELTGKEEVIASRQSELGDGQPVRAVPGTW